MSAAIPSPSSTIFVLRVWQEELGHGSSEWRGEIKNVVTGEVRYFRTWQGLAALMPGMLVRNATPGSAAFQEN